MNILGISAYYHDSAAALVVDGKIIAAAQEERFTRHRHDAGFPAHAVRYCLAAAGLRSSQLDYVVFYDKPFLKFERLLETHLAFAPHGLRGFVAAMPTWIKQKLFFRRLLVRELSRTFGSEGDRRINWDAKLRFTQHHLAHAASAFFPSPFDRAAVLTLDGVGEWATASVGVGQGNDLRLLYALHFPHSVGLLYSAFTYFTGFKVNSAEYKVMGLAPYGQPRYVERIYEHLIDLKPDGSFTMNMEYFNYCAGLTMTNGKFAALFDGPPRQPETPLTQREMDLARSVQDVVEEIVLRMARFLRQETGEENLCLAGGVALNCVANGRLLQAGLFKHLWIQPAAGDAGGALGATLAMWHQYLRNPRQCDGCTDGMQGAYLGPAFSQETIEAFLQQHRIPFARLDDTSLTAAAVEHLAEGKVVGWFQGRMEFGPRALGNRSILGDPRNTKMQAIMNLKIKYRESFRPFAPSVLRERVGDYFALDCDSPYMLLVAPVQYERRLHMTETERQLWGIDLLNVPRSDIPAVTHVDYSARIQTVDRETNPRYYDLLNAFEGRTGCPLLVNTSFNVRGEPIVCTPEEAYGCFMRTEMDTLVIGNCLLEKRAQPAWKESADWRRTFALD